MYTYFNIHSDILILQLKSDSLNSLKLFLESAYVNQDLNTIQIVPKDSHKFGLGERGSEQRMSR